jgi:hypothetical protein
MIQVSQHRLQSLVLLRQPGLLLELLPSLYLQHSLPSWRLPVEEKLIALIYLSERA